MHLLKIKIPRVDAQQTGWWTTPQLKTTQFSERHQPAKPAKHRFIPSRYKPSEEVAKKKSIIVSSLNIKTYVTIVTIKTL